MSQAIEVKVPDIGDYKDIPVIEVLVAPGDTVEAEQSLLTLESDKATMDVPSPSAGTVKEVKVKVGDTVSEGTLIVLLEGGAATAPAAKKEAAPAAPAQKQEAAPKQAAASAPAPSASSAPAPAGSGSIEVKVPDIGDYKDIPVIEILVKEGDTVEAEQALLTLESDKATMDVPSPSAGKVKSIKVKVGDNVSEGTLIVELEGAGSAAPARAKAEPAPAAPAAAPAKAPAPAASQQGTSLLAEAPAIGAGEGSTYPSSHASPSVRKFARELGVIVSRVKGTGPKGRITQADVTAFVKGVMSAPAASGAPVAAAGGGTGVGLDLLPWPKIDFTKFGPIDPQPLSRIKKISGANLHRNWVMIPHVTNNDEADITELEALRVTLNKENEKSGIKVTMLAFVIKAVVAALKKFPTFNASLDGDTLVLKQYYHIGFAADTPNGLVVPVIRDADKKGLLQIAQEMADLSKLARDGKLKGEQMQGGCFSISSLGGIGGTHFTPIINAPEVAILGLSRGAMKPVWDGKQFVPRLTLPMSLSYDHRVIDGASAARFNAYLGGLLADFRRVIL
ncbi:dihydrolipoyllysine-residue acetyltransferase [Pararobbsia alpina]|uniref:Acetyltransferase component of pyruvate dehydrogenase complex n=1 Tax=Pararobbsia alpina TaxID=621374 RepID=A0A6S7BFZ0_9BURK|nr:dihydrolipoyllysine-residue acetyltransferase [Pararobbsia alpina]CAB3798943.1 Dihydrolipoyllysine-residue acetyltransferase component of pyruvate dehydrogenase complex [Pararobbsia alpina]